MDKDEEALKRNTDCVYFLASPLTCKKGNDCEYRHSESARINPRDCWFWLSGNCLNANCPFRHPPLDGRPAASSAQPAVATKARVPCFFFSQGFCSKGDKCSFMHGPTAILNTEATASQKLSKPPVGKSTESKEKQATANKGNGSITPKPVTESSQEVQTASETMLASKNEIHVHPKAVRPAQDQFPIQNDATRARVPPEGSVSSGPARPHGHQTLSGDDRLRQAPPGDDILRQAQSSDDRLRQLQSGEDRLRQIQPGEERIQNSMEAEEWWEESSPGFDVLVDDGPDQLVYPEDAEYLSQHDVTMDPGRAHRMMHTDDLAEFDYDHPSTYDQSRFYDTPGQYDHGSYDPYDQQLGYEHVNSYDHIRRQQTIAFNDRPAPFNDRGTKATLVRDRRRVVVDGGIRRSDGDLRNCITKRRRVERVHQPSGDIHRRQHQALLVSDYQQGHRHQDDRAKQQEVLMRHQILRQQRTRPNQRRPHGKVEVVGKKRAHHDIGSDYDGASPQRISLKSSPNKRSQIEHAKAKLKEKEQGQLSSEAASASEVRRYSASNSKKAESKNESSNFDGPKSLAQIKAEKRKAVEEENLKGRDMPDEFKSTVQSLPHGNTGTQRQAMSLRSQISPAAGSIFDAVRSESSAGEERKVILGKSVTHESVKAPDFEGPKPLSVILKAKRKAKSEIEFRYEDTRKEQVTMKMTDSGTITPVSVDKEVEDGELLQETNPTQVSNLPVFDGSERKNSGTPKQVLGNHMENEIFLGEAGVLGLRSNDILGTFDGSHGREGEDAEGLDPTEDMEDGTETGDNEDEEFGLDDDDEDDFAKKLGGFFS